MGGLKYKSILLCLVSLFTCQSFVSFLETDRPTLSILKELPIYNLTEAVHFENKSDVQCIRTDFVDFLELLYLFENLSYLELKDLDYFPIELTKLKQLRILNLSENYELKSLKGIGELSGLEEVSIASTEIALIPNEVKNLTFLRNLELKLGVKLNDVSNLSYLPSLQYLNLTGSDNIKVFPTTISALQHLKVSNVSCYDYIYYALKASNHLSSIKKLEINGSKDLTIVPYTFENLDSLTDLNLSNNPYLFHTDNLKNLTQLEHLNLSFCHNLRTLSPSISSLQNLKVLNLSNNLNLKDISGIQDLNNIETLFLSSKDLLFTIPEEKREKFITASIIIKNKVPRNGITYY